MDQQARARIAELRAKFDRPLADDGDAQARHERIDIRAAQPRYQGLESGHRACQGCGEALAARGHEVHVICSRRRYGGGSLTPAAASA